MWSSSESAEADSWGRRRKYGAGGWELLFAWASDRAYARAV